MNVRLKPAQKVKILNANDLYTIMQHVLLRENKIRRNREHFWVVGLNNANTILFIELVSLGASNRVQVAPPEVFRVAIYKLASKVILVHNHPSGVLKVSEADRLFTARMMAASDLIDIALLDHLVITETKYLSFGGEGVMRELHNLDKVMLAAKEKGLLQQAVKDAKKEWKVEQAIKMKREGLSVETIVSITGLKKSEVHKL